MIRVVLEHRTRNAEDTQKLVEVIKETRAIARKQPGFVTGETLLDADDPRHLVVISTWRRLDDWNAWNESRTRLDMRWMIEELLEEPYTTTVMSPPSTDILWQERIQHVF
jgi:heme oxygenase (mycobilin-producing)